MPGYNLQPIEDPLLCTSTLPNLDSVGLLYFELTKCVFSLVGL